MPCYSSRSLSVSFRELPCLAPKLLVTQDTFSLLRWWKATKRRSFRLVKPWTVVITIPQSKTTTGKVTRLRGLVGTIEIPCSQNEYLYDGASVPLPWVVTCLTCGVLRPLGIMLTASILHDYSFSKGHLPFKLNEVTKQTPVERHDADLLFREMINAVNGMPIWAFWAWSAVRLGWLFVKYHNKRWAGKPPTGHILGLVALLVVTLQACP